MPRVIITGYKADGTPIYGYSEESPKADQKVQTLNNKGQRIDQIGTQASSRTTANAPNNSLLSGKLTDSSNTKVNPTTIKTITDFGGDAQKYRSYLNDLNKTGTGTAFDFDNPSGMALTKQQQNALDALTKQDQQANQLSGGTTTQNLRGDFLSSISSKGGSVLGTVSTSDPTKVSISYDLGKDKITKSVSELLKNPPKKSDFIDADGNYNPDAYTDALNSTLSALLGLSEKAKEESTLLNTTTPLATDTTDAAPTYQSKTEAELLAEFEGTTTAKDLKSKEERDLALRDQITANKIAEAKAAMEQRLGYQEQVAALMGTSDSRNKSAIGIEAAAGTRLGMIQRQESANLADLELSLEAQRNEIADQYKAAWDTAVGNYLTAAREDAKNKFDAEFDVWKEKNAQKEKEADNERADRIEQRQQDEFGLSQDKFTFDVLKYQEEQEKTANEKYGEEIYKLYKDSGGKIGGYALSQYLSEEGIPLSQDDIGRLTNGDSYDVLDWFSDPKNATALKTWSKLPKEVRDFQINELPSIEAQIKIQALSNTLASGVVSSGGGGGSTATGGTTKDDVSAIFQYALQQGFTPREFSSYFGSTYGTTKDAKAKFISGYSSLWNETLNMPTVARKDGTDSVSLMKKAIQAGISRDIDKVNKDTQGAFFIPSTTGGTPTPTPTPTTTDELTAEEEATFNSLFGE